MLPCLGRILFLFFYMCTVVQINNAGVLIHDGSKSVDGYEINFATNTLGTYALTCGLEPALKASAPSRVIMVSSGGALTAHLETVDLEGVKIKSKDGSDFYARDKRRQIALAEYFDEEWKNDGVHCCSMHPGWVETEGVKSSIPGFYNAFRSKLRNLEQGADTIVWLSVCPDVDIQGGEFYLDRKVTSKHLFMAGTKYSREDLQKLVRNLNRYREEKM
jgi:dehydrogenase/reductase SDR family protein 12